MFHSLTQSDLCAIVKLLFTTIGSARILVKLLTRLSVIYGSKFSVRDTKVSEYGIQERNCYPHSDLRGQDLFNELRFHNRTILFEEQFIGQISEGLD